MNAPWPAGVSDGLSIPCSVCGELSPFDWRCGNETWDAVIPKPFRRGVVCLPCFAGMADETDVGIADTIDEVQFIGPGYTLGLRPAFVVTHATGEIRSCDSDRSPKGRDAKRLDGEAATARAEGIAQKVQP